MTEPMVNLLGALLLMAAALGPLAALLAQVTPPEPSTLGLWTAALAVLTTIASSLILQVPRSWGPWLKRAVVALVAAVLTVAGLYYEGKLDTTDWSRTWLLVFLGATAIYTLLWRPVSDALKGQPQT